MKRKERKILYEPPTNKEINELLTKYKKEKLSNFLFSKKLIKMKGELTKEETAFNLILAGAFFIVTAIYEFGPPVINKVVESTSEGQGVKALATGGIFTIALIAIFYWLIKIQKKIVKLSFKINVMEEFKDMIIFRKTRR